MSPRSAPRTAAYARFPCVSGDEPALKASTEKVLAFSSRERG